MNMNYSELERAASLAGNSALAEAYARIMELESEVEKLEETISDTETLAAWEKNHGSAQQYYEFFYDCFAQLDGRYQSPEVGSGYDCGVIFEAIKRGELARSEGDNE